MWLRITSLLRSTGTSIGRHNVYVSSRTLSISPSNYRNPIDDSHTPKKLNALSGSSMTNVCTSQLALESRSDEPESRVLVLYTGGTIGMKAVDGVYSPAPGFLPRMIRDVPMLNDRAFVYRHYGSLPVRPNAMPPVRGTKRRVVYRIVEYHPLLDSCDMTFDDWIRVAEDIQKAYDRYDGFVVLHGTDTLAYTASALSFMMENLGKPVVVTGSQIPVAETRSDGLDNLVGALIAAGNLEIPEVCVYFNNKLMRGNRTVKIDNADLDAFQSPNMPPLAKMAINIKMNKHLLNARPKGKKFSVQRNLCRQVGVLRIFPSMSTDTVKSALQEPTKGVVLQTLGSGNIPSRRKDIVRELKAAVDRGCVVVNCSQCLRGRVDGSYATGKVLEDIGVIPGADMTPEAAMAKLCYVLGRDDWDLAKKREMMQKNLRGELRESTVNDERKKIRRPTAKELGLLKEAMRQKIDLRMILDRLERGKKG